MSPTWEVRQGDCVALMRELDECSVDAVVCDPPYGLEFMGKEWDRLSGQPGYQERGRFATVSNVMPHLAKGPNSYQAGRPMQKWHEAWATEALRVLKPGGHLLVFGGTRTYHRLAAGVEDAGFEIRDCLAWLFGSGFPKSLNVSKAIDRAAGAERPVVGRTRKSTASMGPGEGPFSDDAYEWQGEFDRTGPATAEAECWEGWGTALKPAYEPVVVARKPLVATVAGNVLEHGTGALNVDGCRIMNTPEDRAASMRAMSGERMWRRSGIKGAATFDAGCAAEPSMNPSGRWPANVVLDGEAAGMLDEQTGDLHSQDPATRRGKRKAGHMFQDPDGEDSGARYGDTGGASRFFYVAKASRAERNAGLDGFEAKMLRWSSGDQSPGTFQSEGTDRAARNHHPTVKPIDLMRWLCRLVTPPGGLVLDPFTGSGTTGCAAVLEGFDFLGLEREAEYVEIAKARVGWWHKHRGMGEAAEVLAAGAARETAEAQGQVSIFDLLDGEAA